ncbi:MAG: hypothetical protein QNJ47_15645 [Nostocaceae cyanobacterium]|nr:hypothetical protein [Nostocaceae cyanobacterium]
MIMTILRKFTVVFLSLSLCLTTVACGGGEQTTSSTPRSTNTSNTVTNTRLSDGQYPVQQASYNDANGEYNLFLINSNPPNFRTDKLQMARLTDEEIKEGKKTFLKVDNGQPVLYLTEDFKIEYVHNVTETRNNPQTGQQETVIVRQQSNFWAPFAGALAGQAIGSLLFRPQYYVPPVYQPGGVMTGYGGYGNTYDVAVNRYRERYNAPPAAVKNRTAFRTTGSIRKSYPSSSGTSTNKQRTGSGSRATGSGFGSSTLRQSGKSSSTRRRSGSSFGSGGKSRRPSGFGSGGRRRR